MNILVSVKNKDVGEWVGGGRGVEVGDTNAHKEPKGETIKREKKEKWDTQTNGQVGVGGANSINDIR